MWYRDLSFSIAVALIMCTPASKAQSWNLATGIIESTSLSYDNNFAFRITLNQAGVYPLANCKSGFAYLNNVPNENYDAKVSALMTAYSIRKQVKISYVIDSNGWCQITDITV